MRTTLMESNKDYVTAKERLQHLEPKPGCLFKRLLKLFRAKKLKTEE